MMANYATAMEKAKKVLAESGFNEPPIDPEVIAESRGVDVVYAKFKPEASAVVSGFIEFLNDTAGNKDGARIVVNSDMSAAEKTFTIAHELAHYLLHKDYAKGKGYKVMLRLDKYTEYKPVEDKEADVFATALLAPKKLLKKYQKYASLDEMSKMFIVSEDRLKRQIRNNE